MDHPARVEKWKAHIAFLEGECVALERAWARIPKMFWLCLILPVPACLWSVVAAVLTFLLTLSFIGVVSWLTGVRKKEAKWELDIARQQLAEFEHEAASLPPSAG